MRRSFIHLLNLALLVIVLIGLPAVASARLGGLGLSSIGTRHLLVFWGTAAAAIVNLVLLFTLAKSPPDRKRCLEWMFSFLALLGAEWLYFNGHLQFGWLKDWLLKLKQ
jgi:hypothetical protein